MRLLRLRAISSRVCCFSSLHKQTFAVLTCVEKLAAVIRLWTMEPVAQTSIYKALNTLTNEIRLLSFMPTIEPNGIGLQLDVVNINKAPPYRALSYVWGDPTITEPICLNGVNFKVTKNLYTALQAILEHYSGDSEFRYFWIDAICINQNDATEKTRQVGLMYDIYSRATEVIMWLGEEDEDSHVAMSLVKQWVKL